jgi:hypothetical protein
VQWIYTSLRTAGQPGAPPAQAPGRWLMSYLHVIGGRRTMSSARPQGPAKAAVCFDSVGRRAGEPGSLVNGELKRLVGHPPLSKKTRGAAGPSSDENPCRRAQSSCMAAPGFSVSELIQAASKLVDVYKSFNDKYDNAQSRVRDLAGFIELFRANLIDLQWILSCSGKDYPGQDAFRRTLEECDEFIHRYRDLFDKRPSLAKTLKTASWAFEERNITRLIRQLTLHSQAIAGFEMNLLL